MKLLLVQSLPAYLAAQSGTVSQLAFQYAGRLNEPTSPWRTGLLLIFFDVEKPLSVGV